MTVDYDMRYNIVIIIIIVCIITTVIYKNDYNNCVYDVLCFQSDW